MIQANLQLAGVPIGTTQVDVVLPSQHFAARRKQGPAERLMIAVLHDALDCIEKYRFAIDPKGRADFHDAKRWFLASEAHWPYSFECICGVLELDPDAVRQRLRLGAAKQTAELRVVGTRESLR